VLVIHPEPGQTADGALRTEISRRNSTLLNYKRVAGYVIWDSDFPRNAGLKIMRPVLAEQIARRLDRGATVAL
jgi:acyl-coenzyme A synthetase/AMP-(fatty) acid ligase